MAKDILKKSFAEKLDQREDIKAIECNVRLVGLSIGEGYTRFMPKEKLFGAFAGCEEDEILAYGPDGRMMGRFDSLFSLEFVRSDFVASSIPVILSGYKGGLIKVYGKTHFRYLGNCYETVGDADFSSLPEDLRYNSQGRTWRRETTCLMPSRLYWPSAWFSLIISFRGISGR